MLRVLKQYFPIRNALFFTLEGGVIFLSFFISSAVLTISPSYYFDAMLVLRIVFVTLVCQLCLYYNDLYDFDVVKTLPEMAIRLLQSLGAASILLALVYFLFPLAIINQVVFILSILLLLLFVTGWRLIYLNILNKGVFNEKIIILGSSELSIDIIDRIKNTIDCGYQISSVYPDSDNDIKSQLKVDTLKVTYNIDNICQTAVSAGVKKIVTVLKEQRGAFPMKQLIQCRTLGIEIIDGCSFYEQLTGKVLVQKINPSWLVFSEGFKKSALRNFLKRTQDLIGSLVLLILLSPLLALVAVLIKIDSKGPVLFAQDRVGRNKKEFMMHKFRSMVHDAEKLTGPVWAGQDDPRITRMGRIIRKCRIDELPQLWDVLTGKMSLVGPRPERKYFTDQLEEQIPFYPHRFLVKPGITGWAQICYDYGATVEDAVEKLNYELFYIKNMSTMFDLVILLRTLKIVIFGKGAR